MRSKRKCADLPAHISELSWRAFTVFEKAVRCQRRESVRQAELREDRKRGRYRGCSKNQVFQPNAPSESLRAAADRNAQLDPLQRLPRLTRRLRRPRLRQLPRPEHGRWPHHR
jgi:hypothetical protein